MYISLSFLPNHSIQRGLESSLQSISSESSFFKASSLATLSWTWPWRFHSCSGLRKKPKSRNNYSPTKGIVGEKNLSKPWTTMLRPSVVLGLSLNLKKERSKKGRESENRGENIGKIDFPLREHTITKDQGTHIFHYKRKQQHKRL